MPRHKKTATERLSPPPEPPLPALDRSHEATGRGFSHENLCSLREVTRGNLDNLHEEIQEARAKRAATIANLEAWRDELNEAIAILRAHE
jgi:uncharacterized membrane protein